MKWFAGKKYLLRVGPPWGPEGRSLALQGPTPEFIGGLKASERDIRVGPQQGPTPQSVALWSLAKCKHLQ